jgi:hypothetical protein
MAYPGFEPGPPRSEVSRANHCAIGAVKDIPTRESPVGWRGSFSFGPGLARLHQRLDVKVNAAQITVTPRQRLQLGHSHVTAV